MTVLQSVFWDQMQTVALGATLAPALPSAPHEADKNPKALQVPPQPQLSYLGSLHDPRLPW